MVLCVTIRRTLYWMSDEKVDFCGNLEECDDLQECDVMSCLENSSIIKLIIS